MGTDISRPDPTVRSQRRNKIVRSAVPGLIVLIVMGSVWLSTRSADNLRGIWAFFVGAFGDGARAAQAFDTTFCIIDRSAIVSGGPPKDGIPSLTDPKVVPVARADYPDGRGEVIGVVLGGQARAYPLGILAWHEAINDTLGGVPIVVTYCPLCHSALVFKREIGGQVREFGISGLLYQSNVLLYDRQRRAAEESLWSQAAMKAVCGPAAKDGLRLELVDAVLTTFDDWRRRYPLSDVVSEQTGFARPYRQVAYAEYLATDHLMFPVSTRSNRRPDLKTKDSVVVITVGDRSKAYAIRDLEAAPESRIEDVVGGVPITLTRDRVSGAVDVRATDGRPDVAIRKAYMFWFTYDAFYPAGDLYEPPSRR